MTKKTEVEKREMYELLKSLKKAKKHPKLLHQFECALEQHLENLRQDFVIGISRLADMTEERDQIQLRLHAIDHAYHTQQRANVIAGDQLRDQAQLIKRQREVIGELFMENRAPAIKLTPYEIQSGYDRVKWAEGLIVQLPEDHEGRNSWLLNYASQPW